MSLTVNNEQIYRILTPYDSITEQKIDCVFLKILARVNYVQRLQLLVRPYHIKTSFFQNKQSPRRILNPKTTINWMKFLRNFIPSQLCGRIGGQFQGYVSQ